MLYAVPLPEFLRQSVKLTHFTTKRWKNVMHDYYHQMGSQVFDIAWRLLNVARHDTYLHFQGHEFGNLNIMKAVRTSKKCSVITFRGVLFAVERHHS